MLWSEIFPCVFDISCFRFLVFLGAPFAFVAHLCTDRATLADRCPPHVPHRQKPYSARNYWKKIILLSISVNHIHACPIVFGFFSHVSAGQVELVQERGVSETGSWVPLFFTKSLKLSLTASLARKKLIVRIIYRCPPAQDLT